MAVLVNGRHILCAANKLAKRGVAHKLANRASSSLPFRNRGTRLIHQAFKKFGSNDYIGERVSQQEHMIQCAMRAEEAFPEDREMIVGAFLHDVGHILDDPGSEDAFKRMGEFGVAKHETLGADFARNTCGLSERVASAISGHVAAKRYLVATDPEYFGRLTEASKATLRYQGGPMKQEEVEEYEKEGMLDFHLTVRKFDEAAKDPDCTMKPLEYYLQMVDDMLDELSKTHVEKTSLTDDGQSLLLTWGDGHKSVFDCMWLRDNDQGSLSKHPGNGQRLFDLVDIPRDLKITSVQNDKGEVVVDFVGTDYMFTANFDTGFLRRHCYSTAEARKSASIPRDAKGGILHRLLWNRAGVAQGSLPQGGDVEKQLVHFHDYELLLKGRNKRIFDSFVRFGFFLIENVPVRDGAILDIPSIFNGAVRRTNYGDLFDVRVEPNPTNLAYTAGAVSPHTDNPYRFPVPTVQILHCLENDCPSGAGATGLVDGFLAAEKLKSDHPAYFDLLSKHFMNFEYSNVHAEKDRAYLRNRQPLIQVDDTGSVFSVAFNNRSASPLQSVPPENMAEYYQAYRTFADILFAPESRLLIRLKPGQAMVFDNTRVLHMRESIEGVTGSRWLQGCYADKDALFSARGME